MDLATYVKTYIGLDCNGFVGNYFGLSPEVKPRACAQGMKVPAEKSAKQKAGISKAIELTLALFPLKGRQAADQVQSGDVVITVRNDAPVHSHEHIALIDTVRISGAEAAIGLAEWGAAGGIAVHSGPAALVTLTTGPAARQWSNYDLRWASGNAHRHIFAPPLRPIPRRLGPLRAPRDLSCVTEPAGYTPGRLHRSSTSPGAPSHATDADAEPDPSRRADPDRRRSGPVPCIRCRHRHRRRIHQPDGQHLKLNLARPRSGQGPFPAVLCIHDGGFRAGHRKVYDTLCRQLAGRGYVAATVDYRLAPGYPFPAAIHDAKAAVRWLRAHAEEYRIDPDRIGVTGNSAGGHLAQFLGMTPGRPQIEGDGGHAGQSSRFSSETPFDPRDRLGLADERFVPLARRTYDERAFGRMAIQGDALEGVRRTDKDLLTHCGGPGEHVRGCWVGSPCSLVLSATPSGTAIRASVSPDSWA